jgi:hypothetical protein
MGKGIYYGDEKCQAGSVAGKKLCESVQMRTLHQCRSLILTPSCALWRANSGKVYAPCAIGLRRGAIWKTRSRSAALSNTRRLKAGRHFKASVVRACRGKEKLRATDRMKLDERQAKLQTHSDHPSNGETLAPIGRRGAAAALERLELAEERAHARLEAALARGEPVQIAACQDFWLKCSETLRRLDLAVELARRDAEEQVPKRLACDVALYISDWLRISFMIFLSSESRTLMGIKDIGEFKNHAVQAFKSILHLTVRNSLKTQSPIPDWGLQKIKESWNMQ